jgi:glycosyltransferase involved in cell wall biosynthesis
MAVGLPVIATSSGAHPELLGDLGLYFEPGDADDCAAALRCALADDSWRRRTGHALRERQQRVFSLQEHGRRLEETYYHLHAASTKGDR